MKRTRNKRKFIRFFNHLKRLLYGRPKISFINYRKEFKGKYPIRGILPNFNKYWFGKIWQLSWRGFAIQADFRGGFKLINLLTEKEKIDFYKRVDNNNKIKFKGKANAQSTQEIEELENIPLNPTEESIPVDCKVMQKIAGEKYKMIIENREKFIEAFIAETGLMPSQCEMIEEQINQPDFIGVKIYFRKRI